MATIGSLLDAAREEGWKPASVDKPPVGERVDVMHVLARSYDCDGEVDEAGVWHCSNGFILPGGRAGILAFNPTHWRARATGEQA